MTRSMITVRLILDEFNGSWIIGKFARRLAEHLAVWDVNADIATHPSQTADVNHWMIYQYPWMYYPENPPPRGSQKSTLSITHVDDVLKLKMLKMALDRVSDVGICLSKQTMDDLVLLGIPPRKLCFITPGHDSAVSPRRITIGITTRLYSDGRKRESLLLDVARKMSLEPFKFEIHGDGWQEVIPHLKDAGAVVEYFPGSADSQSDYALMLKRIPNFDYYLYTGMDEGSMGTLDALAAGVPTIVTPQGFHRDIPNGITHPFVSSNELQTVFKSIIDARMSRIASAGSLTWRNYAQRHALLWHAIVNNIPVTLEDPSQIKGTLGVTVSASSIFRRLQILSGLYKNTLTSSFLPLTFARWKSALRAIPFLRWCASKLKPLR